MTHTQQAKAKLERIWWLLYEWRTEARNEQEWHEMFAASECVAQILRDWRTA